MKIKCHIILDWRTVDVNQSNAMNELLESASTIEEGMNIIRQQLNNDNEFIETNNTFCNKSNIVSITVFEDK